MSGSAKLNVTVRRDGTQVSEAAQKPVRRMPDGIAGVVFRGAVYPVYSDHSIELADEGTSKDDCPGFFSFGEDLVYADAEEEEPWWYLEHARHRSYLAFDGSEVFAERLNAAFEAEGMSGGYSESFRPAKDGNYYDYFIRLPVGADADHVQRVLNTVFNQQPVGSVWAEALSKMIDNLGGPQKFIEDLLSKAENRRELERQNQELEENVLKAQSALEATRDEASSLREERGRLRALCTGLQKERDELLEKANTAIVTSVVEASAAEDRLLGENERLRAELMTKQQENADATELLELFEQDISQLREELHECRGKCTSLQRKVDQLRSPRRPIDLMHSGGSRTKREKQLLNDLLSGAFPRLEFEGKDCRAMLRDFVSLYDCAKVFATLQRGQHPKNCKPFSGKDGVWEIPGVRTGVKGRERMGRIYFKASGPTDKVQVRVHLKDGDGKQQGVFVTEAF